MTSRERAPKSCRTKPARKPGPKFDLSNIRIPPRKRTLRAHSDRKAEMNDIAVTDNVILSLQTKLAGLLAFGFASQSDEVFIGDHFGTDEAALDVAVNFSRRFARRRALCDGPGAHLVFACGKKADQIQKPVRSLNESASRRLLDPDLLQEGGAIGFVELSDFHFGSRRKRQAVKLAPLEFRFVRRIQCV